MYERLIQLNNQGIEAVHNDPESALSLFAAALVTAKDVAEKPWRLNLERVHSLPEFLPSAAVVEQPAIVDYAFVQPIYLTSSHATAFSRDPLITLAVTVAIVEFNRSILHHLYGLQDGNDNSNDNRSSSIASTSMITQAKVGYVRALEILCRVEAHTKNNAVVDLLRLAIYNNLAQIQAILCDYKASQELFLALTEYAATICADSYDAETTIALCWFTKAFMRHKSIMSCPPTAAAA
jgi:hypothetical protein